MLNTIYATLGKDFSESIPYLNDDTTAKDLTGYSSYMNVAKYYNSPDKITITGTISTPETDGIVTYESTSAVIASLGFGCFVYSRYLVNSLNSVESVVSGNFVIVPSVV